MAELHMDAATTALIVIDLQKGIVGMQGAPHAGPDVVRNAAALADACRAQGMPVFLVRVTPSRDRKDALHPAVDEPMAGGAPPPDWADIVSEMNVQDGDFVITKRQWGAFYGTELDLQLRRRGIRTIVLCGIATSIGVESTARSAFELGYDQVFAEDAMTSRNAEEHDSTVTNIFPRLGRVRSTAEILEALG